MATLFRMMTGQAVGLARATLAQKRTVNWDKVTTTAIHSWRSRMWNTPRSIASDVEFLVMARRIEIAAKAQLKLELKEEREIAAWKRKRRIPKSRTLSTVQHREITPATLYGPARFAPMRAPKVQRPELPVLPAQAPIAPAPGIRVRSQEGKIVLMPVEGF